jgi:hypothetical protein
MHNPTTSHYAALNAQLAVLCDDFHNAGWVTFTTHRLPDGRIYLVQKNDGCTRTIPAISR